MASVRYAPLAEDDLDDVAVWTRKQFGEAQVGKYLDELADACEWLAENAGLARFHRGRRAGVRRWEHGSHVIFFEVSGDGILVGRIIHKSRMPSKHGL